VRWAFLADVHGNLEALRAVLRDLEDWPDHRLICAGDIVGYGPDPEACLELLSERAATCVAGNHEGMVVGRIGFGRCVYAGILAAVWTRAHLSRWALERLVSLPAVAQPSPEIVVCHAVPDDVEHYVMSAQVAEPALAAASRDFPGTELLVSGHTHFAAIAALDGGRGAFRLVSAGAAEPVAAGRLHLVNPGSVGQPRDGRPVARYARYDSATRTVRWRAVAYDSAPTLAKLRSQRLVARVCYSFPQPWLERKLEVARSRWARARFSKLPPLS
jgi:diadenosine tetraphosphatase ApaH/serine/threonine PP2A family protein phosphatase